MYFISVKQKRFAQTFSKGKHMELLRNISISKIWPVTEIPANNVEICLVKAVIKSVLQGTNPQGEAYHKFIGSFLLTNLETNETVRATSCYFPGIVTEQLFETFQSYEGITKTERKRFDPKTGAVASIAYEYAGATLESAFKVILKPDAPGAKPTIKGYSWGCDILTTNDHNPFANLDLLLTSN